MFKHERSILGYDIFHIIAGDDKPLPISSNVFAEFNSAILPISSHSLFCASIGEVVSLDQYPKFSMSPSVASCITGDNVL